MLMKRCLGYAVFLALALTQTGCSSTLTVRDVGIGMQLGGVSGHGGIIAPFVWGTGVILEQVGDVINSGSYASPDQTEPEIIQLGETPQPESQPVD